MTARARALLASGLLALCIAIASRPDTALADPSGSPHAFVVLVPDVTLADLLDVPDVAALARAGGAGWISPELDVRSLRRGLAAFSSASQPSAATGRDVTVIAAPSGRSSAVGSVLEAVAASVAPTGQRRVLVVVAGTTASRSMAAAKDDLRPIVVARGRASDVFGADGALETITSESTRRTGIVASVDVEATVDAFVGRSTADDAGHPITFVDERPPFELHERYLAMRRMMVPVQTAAALYVTIGGLFALVVLRIGRRAPVALGVVASGIAMSIGPLAAALLAAGHLPTLSYATVVPFAVLVTAVVVAAVLLGATRDVLYPVLPLGVALLAFLLVEDLLGWTAALTPFLGGSELDGGRFYGLPNVFIGLLLGASLYAASRLPPFAGFALIVAAGLFAGLPFAGANLGAAVTLFAAAGLWLPLRIRGRLGWRELAVAVVVVLVGTAVVLVAHRLSPLPTHVTRFEETEGAAGAWSTFVARLGVGWRLVVRNPFALVPVVGVLATLAVVLRPPGAIRPSLARHRAWREALLVILLASVVAYVVNDSGPAACGVGFGMALGGLFYVSVAERTWKMASA